MGAQFPLAMSRYLVSVVGTAYPELNRVRNAYCYAPTAQNPAGPGLRVSCSAPPLPMTASGLIHATELVRFSNTFADDRCRAT